MTDQTGHVYRWSKTGKLDTLINNGPSPNGLVLSPDEKVGSKGKQELLTSGAVCGNDARQ
jgi:hypothetical protein